VTTPLRFVLVRPRSPGNVGSVARAMKNFGFTELVLVDPRLHRAGDGAHSEPYFERESRKMAWHAEDVLEKARTVATFAEGVRGCGLVLATAPHGGTRMKNLTPEEAAEAIANEAAPPPALVFGSESSGLTNEELAACSGVVVIPTDPAYRDLNVAQSAVVMAYICFRRAGTVRPPHKPERATHSEEEAVADGLKRLALNTGFLKSGQEPVARELRALVHRAGLSRREAGLLRSFLRRAGVGSRLGGSRLKDR